MRQHPFRTLCLRLPTPELLPKRGSVFFPGEETVDMSSLQISPITARDFASRSCWTTFDATTLSFTETLSVTPIHSSLLT